MLETMFLVGLLVLVFGVLIGWSLHKLIARIERLEDAAKHGMPYKAIDGLEDAIAIANDVRFSNAGMDRVFDSLISAVNKELGTSFVRGQVSRVTLSGLKS